MKGNEALLYALSQVDGAYVEEARPAPRRGLRRRGLLLLAAVLAALLLTGITGAALAKMDVGGFLQSLWLTWTGGPMGESQTAAAEHLSQPLGVSRTVGEVTVTLDSVLMGDDCFFLLVKASGPEFSSRRGYSFENMSFSIRPEPKNGGMGAMGFSSGTTGTDGQGNYLWLMDFSFSWYDPENTEPLTLDVTFQNLMRGEACIAEGEWALSAQLDRTRLPESRTLGDLAVQYRREADGQLQTAVMENTVLTETGLRFALPDSVTLRELEGETAEPPFLTLEDGGIVRASGSMGSHDEKTDRYLYTCRFDFPVALEDAVTLTVGESVFPLT